MDDLTQSEFLARFKAEMLRYATTFDDGTPVADYADKTGPTYWEEEELRKDGPEACARADVSYWRDA